MGLLNKNKIMIVVTRSVLGILFSLLLMGQTYLSFSDSEAAVLFCLVSTTHHSEVINQDRATPRETHEKSPKANQMGPICCHQSPSYLSFVLNRPPLIQEVILGYTLDPPNPFGSFMEVFYTPEVPPG